MSNFIDKSVYLGGPEDPKPVWRDEAEDAEDWPEAAVFAVMFLAEDHDSATARHLLPRTEYYGADGWPTDLPAWRKGLSEPIRREFQVYPWLWRSWGTYDWTEAEEFPELFKRGRALAAMTPRLARLTSAVAER